MREQDGAVTATQVVRDFNRIKRMCARGPVTINSHGKADLVLLSIDQFDELKNGTAGVDPDHLAHRYGAKLDLVLNAIDTLVLILDANLRIRRMNRAYCEVAELSEIEHVDQPLASIYTSGADQFLLARVREVLESGQPDMLNMPAFNRPDRVYQHNIRPWPGGVALFIIDITEKIRHREREVANAALDQSLALIDGLGCASIYQDGRVRWAGTGFCRLVGREAGTLIGINIFPMFDPASRAAIEVGFLQPGNAARRIPVRYLRQGIALVDATIKLSPFRDSENYQCAAIVLEDTDLHQPGSVRAG